MCGRFTLTIDLQTLIEIFQIEIPGLNLTPCYNIAPSQPVLTIIKQGGQRMARQMRWGLIPAWAKEPSIGYKLINARAETLEEKPSFRNPFRHRRCLIPADGFYEWRKEGKQKQPYRFTLADQSPFAFAGLWDRWVSPEGSEIISCSIITTEANDIVKPLHDRMPVILAEPKLQQLWLDFDNPGELKDLLKPYAGEMAAYPVSPAVNSPKVDEPGLILRGE